MHRETCDRALPHWSAAAGLTGTVAGILQAFHAVASEPLQPRFWQVLFTSVGTALVVTACGLVCVGLALWFRKLFGWPGR